MYLAGISIHAHSLQALGCQPCQGAERLDPSCQHCPFAATGEACCQPKNKELHQQGPSLMRDAARTVAVVKVNPSNSITAAVQDVLLAGLDE